MRRNDVFVALVILGSGPVAYILLGAQMDLASFGAVPKDHAAMSATPGAGPSCASPTGNRD